MLYFYIEVKNIGKDMRLMFNRKKLQIKILILDLVKNKLKFIR